MENELQFSSRVHSPGWAWAAEVKWKEGKVSCSVDLWLMSLLCMPFCHPTPHQYTFFCRIRLSDTNQNYFHGHLITQPLLSVQCPESLLVHHLSDMLPTWKLLSRPIFHLCSYVKVFKSTAQQWDVIPAGICQKHFQQQWACICNSPHHVLRQEIIHLKFMMCNPYCEFPQ